jgi:hypothetical protein
VVIERVRLSAGRLLVAGDSQQSGHGGPEVLLQRAIVDKCEILSASAGLDENKAWGCAPMLSVELCEDLHHADNPLTVVSSLATT